MDKLDSITTITFDFSYRIIFEDNKVFVEDDVLASQATRPV